MPGIEHSSNSRASCQTCRSKIWKGSVRVSTRTREGKNKYHHADCYHRGDKSSFYGFSMLNAEARAAIISDRPTESPATQSAAALPPPACDDPFCENCWATVHARGRRATHKHYEIDTDGNLQEPE